jgi:FemAB-related protein (PEP-CTERM system-associated)
MKIVECGPSRKAEWDAFVAAAPSGSFYHRYGWFEISTNLFGHRTFPLAAVDGTAITGVLPLIQVKSLLFGNILCSMPFVNYGGPCLADPAAEAPLLAEAMRICREVRGDYIEFRSRQPLHGDVELPSSTHKVSLTLDLAPNPDVLCNKFATKHRQEIRRGYKNGLTAKFGGAELLDPFFDVLSESWRNLGTPLYNRGFFERIIDTFGSDIRICVVYANGEPAGAAFDGLHNGTVEGLWLGMRHRFRHLLVGYVLYWELIKEACERGCTRFHLGRSTADSTGEAFKKKWNASVMQLYWSYFLNTRQEMPDLNVRSPKYQAAIAAWQKLPIGVTRAIGPSIAKNIP